MNKNELSIYKKAVKEKYKYHKLWKILAIVFICLTILFATLYFATGDIFRKEINNDVEIVNNGSNNNNGVTINN